MNRQRSRRARRRSRRGEEQAASEASAAPTPAGQAERLGPHYSAGPVHGLPPRAAQAAENATKVAEEEEGPAGPQEDRLAGPAAEQAQAQTGTVTQLPALASKQSRHDQEVVAYATSVRLRGRTDSGPFNFEAHTENVRAARATGCAGCEGADCLHVTGTVVATYSVAPTVTLPSVADFPDLTPCQRRRVQNAIDTILAPHEQQHVTAFRTYNGTTRRAFDLTICRSDWNQSAVDDLVRPEQATRQAAAQAASDALDPFFFDVDLDCQEPRSQNTGGEETPVPVEPAAQSELSS